MYFVLQREKEFQDDIDVDILKRELQKQKYTHNWVYGTTKEICENEIRIGNEDVKCKDVVPVGSLTFIREWIRQHYSVNKLNPIEVPYVLRKYQFLGRDYRIVSKERVENKVSFVKYASELKEFSCKGSLDNLINSDFMKDGLYVQSSIVNIRAEYRVIVFRDNIININYYDGDATVLPDVNKLKIMVNMYMLDSTRPKAYTIDIAVISKENGEDDTIILEVHPFVSVGLYSYMIGSVLPMCYRLGIDYYIQSNIEIQEWEIGMERRKGIEWEKGVIVRKLQDRK